MKATLTTDGVSKLSKSDPQTVKGVYTLLASIQPLSFSQALRAKKARAEERQRIAERIAAEQAEIARIAAEAAAAAAAQASAV